MRLVPLLAVLAVGCSGGNTVTSQGGVAACASAAACDLLDQGGIQACSANVAAVNSQSLAGFFNVEISGAQVNCLAAAGKDCDAAKKCLNNGTTPMSCSSSGPQACNGTFLQSCSSSNGQNFTTQFDCATTGQMCVQGKNSVACGTGTCTGIKADCNGTVLQTCDGNGVLNALDCSALNSVCAVTIGIGHCRGTGAACQTGLGNTNNSLRCDGDNKIVYCFDGQEATFDCSTIQTKCFANAKGHNADCALSNACDPATYSPTCSGTKLSFCNNGRVDMFDCAGGGWTGCDPDRGGRCK